LAPSITTSQRAPGSEPAFGQIGQQSPADRSVLGRALAQPQHVLGALRVDPHRRQHDMRAELHPVNQQRDYLELAPIAAHPFGQFARGAVDEPRAHRALANTPYRDRFRQRTMPGRRSHSCPRAAFFPRSPWALFFMAASSSYPTRSSDRARIAATQISTTLGTSPHYCRKRSPPHYEPIGS
jgi:hypothetical protein